VLTLHQHRNSWKAGAQEDDTDLVKLRRADAWLHLGAGIGCHPLSPTNLFLATIETVRCLLRPIVCLNQKISQAIKKKYGN
jgi:hypothetical protein